MQGADDLALKKKFLSGLRDYAKAGTADELRALLEGQAPVEAEANVPLDDAAALEGLPTDGEVPVEGLEGLDGAEAELNLESLDPELLKKLLEG